MYAATAVVEVNLADVAYVQNKLHKLTTSVLTCLTSCRINAYEHACVNMRHVYKRENVKFIQQMQFACSNRPAISIGTMHPKLKYLHVFLCIHFIVSEDAYAIRRVTAPSSTIRTA